MKWANNPTDRVHAGAYVIRPYTGYQIVDKDRIQ